MTAFAEGLNFDSLLDRPVINRTGYMETFYVDLKFSPMVSNDVGGKGGGKGNAGGAGPPVSVAIVKHRGRPPLEGSAALPSADNFISFDHEHAVAGSPYSAASILGDSQDRRQVHNSDKSRSI